MKKTAKSDCIEIKKKKKAALRKCKAKSQHGRKSLQQI